MTQQIPKALLQLIEHVELNKSGWWDSALDNVLLAATWMNDKPVPKEQVWDLVASAFNLDIPTNRATDGIERLLRLKQLIETEDGEVATTSSVADQMELRLRAAQSNEEAVRAAFFMRVADCCAPYSPEKSWDLFIERYFLPLIDMLGARTLQFLGENNIGDEHVGMLTDRFVRMFSDSHRTNLRTAIGSFLDPDDLNVRRYVSEHLDASFLVKASGLTNDAIIGISKFGQKPPTFRLFLDTNLEGGASVCLGMLWPQPVPQQLLELPAPIGVCFQASQEAAAEGGRNSRADAELRGKLFGSVSGDGRGGMDGTGG